MIVIEIIMEHGKLLELFEKSALEIDLEGVFLYKLS